MTVTIKDIAKLANVSTTTVSRVINNKYEGVGEETRKRILDLVKELGYQPNALARSLVTKRTSSIGLIIPDIINPFFPDLARGVEDIASKEGYSVILCNTDDDPDKEKKYISLLNEKRVDGIIFTGASTHSHEHILELIKSGVPVILMDRRIDYENTFGVFIENFKGGYDATNYLISLGHKKIGCITGPLNTKESEERFNGYKKALKEAGIDFNEDLVIESNYKITGGADAATELLEKQNVTAIFAFNDMMAYGVYKAAKLLGLKIPDDISVIGFDDVQISQILEPELTTVKQPIYDMGAESAKMLITRIKGKKIKKKIIKFKTELIIRESTKDVTKVYEEVKDE
ncbi:ribose operon repressor [Gottschalkia purinilytica]|uniref:Ribose operon repressor n=1 Tax=Gottschalkia purinilytica TaxID=1503 RepID=A0A0L0WE96_GOTPU|nr:LacI family DNA-binding transcriptional regulator [Gottschalkia purinilytica]KNF09745.1 ribose operon repressor [Gottschalkia purinilytica]